MVTGVTDSVLDGTSLPSYIPIQTLARGLLASGPNCRRAMRHGTLEPGVWDGNVDTHEPAST